MLVCSSNEAFDEMVAGLVGEILPSPAPRKKAFTEGTSKLAVRAGPRTSREAVMVASSCRVGQGQKDAKICGLMDNGHGNEGLSRVGPFSQKVPLPGPSYRVTVSVKNDARLLLEEVLGRALGGHSCPLPRRLQDFREVRRLILTIISSMRRTVLYSLLLLLCRTALAFLLCPAFQTACFLPCNQNN